MRMCNLNFRYDMGIMQGQSDLNDFLDQKLTVRYLYMITIQK